MCAAPFALDDMLKAAGPGFVARLVKARTSCFFRIRSPKDGSFAGLIGVTSIIPMRDAEAQSFMWSRELRHDRVSDKIALTVMGAIFDAFGLERISLLLPVLNLSAARMAERAGFRKEGRSPRVFKFGGTFCDGLRYGILREEAMNRIEKGA